MLITSETSLQSPARVSILISQEKNLSIARDSQTKTKPKPSRVNTKSCSSVSGIEVAVVLSQLNWPGLG